MTTQIDVPNPEAIRNAGRAALMRGSQAVAFPVDDVFKMADSLDRVLIAVAEQNGMLANLNAAAELVVGLGQKLIGIARDGDVPGTGDAFLVFEAALNALEETIVDRSPAEPADGPPAN